LFAFYRDWMSIFAMIRFRDLLFLLMTLCFLGTALQLSCEPQQQRLESAVFGEQETETLEERVERLRKELADAESALAEQQTKSATAENEATVSEAPELPATSGPEIPMGALVVVSGEGGAASGFAASIKGRTFFVTNIHVLGAARDATFTTVEGEAVNVQGVAFVSKNRDIAIVPIEWDGPTLEISSSLKLDDVKMGQAVTVMGNSSGANVATRLRGEIRGIGPIELEVSAKFVPGNSGSPIVHDALGKVVAVASYLKDYKSDSKWTEDTEFDEIRRFGYRLDGDIEWEQVDLNDLYEQSEAYHRFEDRTRVMWNVSYMLAYESQLMTAYSDHESLGYLFGPIDSQFNWRRGTGSAHTAQILKRFISGMINESVSDYVDTQRALKVGYYQKNFDSIQEFRAKIRDNFDKFLQSRY